MQLKQKFLFCPPFGPRNFSAICSRSSQLEFPGTLNESCRLYSTESQLELTAVSWAVYLLHPPLRGNSHHFGHRLTGRSQIHLLSFHYRSYTFLIKYHQEKISSLTSSVCLVWKTMECERVLQWRFRRSDRNKSCLQFSIPTEFGAWWSLVSELNKTRKSKATQVPSKNVFVFGIAFTSKRPYGIWELAY